MQVLLNHLQLLFTKHLPYCPTIHSRNMNHRLWNSIFKMWISETYDFVKLEMLVNFITFCVMVHDDLILMTQSNTLLSQTDFFLPCRCRCFLLCYCRVLLLWRLRRLLLLLLLLLWPSFRSIFLRRCCCCCICCFLVIVRIVIGICGRRYCCCCCCLRRLLLLLLLLLLLCCNQDI